VSIEPTRDDILTDLQGQIADLEAEVATLCDLLWGARCVYCGEIVAKDKQNQRISDAELRKHVETCPKHPLAQARAEVARLTAERDAALAKDAYLSNEELRQEKAAAHAAGANEALDAVEHQQKIGGRWVDGLPEAMEVLRHRYPRPAPEGKEVES
jgi:hypothetical protein